MIIDTPFVSIHIYKKKVLNSTNQSSARKSLVFSNCFVHNWAFKVKTAFFCLVNKPHNIRATWNDILQGFQAQWTRAFWLGKQVTPLLNYPLNIFLPGYQFRKYVWRHYPQALFLILRQKGNVILNYWLTNKCSVFVLFR